MGRLDSYNENKVNEWEDKWLDPDYIFFTCKSTNVEMETEKEENEYTLSDNQVEWLKKECESDDFNHLDKYDWAELLEEFTGEWINTEDIVKVDLESNTITYMK